MEAGGFKRFRVALSISRKISRVVRRAQRPRDTKADRPNAS
jgi:hypothetical protein